MRVINGNGDPSKANELIMYHVMIRGELPELLAELANLGKREEALNLLIQWGTHSRVNSEVWEEAKRLIKEEKEKRMNLKNI